MLTKQSRFYPKTKIFICHLKNGMTGKWMMFAGKLKSGRLQSFHFVRDRIKRV